MRRSIPIALLAWAMVSSAGTGKTVTYPTLGSLSVGKPLPHFAGFEVGTGRPINTKILLRENASRRLIVSFQTTCAPCLQGILALQSARERLSQAKVQVVLIDIQEDEETARDFAKSRGIDFTIAVDPYGRMAGTALGATKSDGNAAAVAQLPTSVLADASGKVLAIFGQEGEDWIERVLR